MVTGDFVKWLDRLSVVFRENRQYLTDLDAAIGDADHGINMDRGFSAVREAVGAEALKAADGTGGAVTVSALFMTVSMTLIKTVGGASGPLLGTFFLKASQAAAGSGSEISIGDTVKAFRAGAEGIKMRGRAQERDKTMLDAWLPAVDAMERELLSGGSDISVLEKGKEAAWAGMEATRMMKALKGRASYLGERSIGHIDPGAASSYLVLEAAFDVLGKKQD